MRVCVTASVEGEPPVLGLAEDSLSESRHIPERDRPVKNSVLRIPERSTIWLKKKQLKNPDNK